eukprot:CAMPEP_0119049456 /NCGR_PEP_ID=MMETSP1177-20130426/64796_1 /TAXON_ID=2985 /ORGANISM="Ochromonas sp, Strain CCMP1899" /LENGTH=763 /DNA_ID=CAMNT_0007026725 /DNA_START=693 /DNA_END=2984 /DNA_ORIENTATION=+
MSINASSSSQLQGTARNLFTEKTQVDLQNKLQSIALQRLILVRTAFKAMASVLFCSETCSSRFGLLGGPEPMSLDTWCSLLASDLYALICKAIGSNPDEEEEQVISALDQSLAQSLSVRASQSGRSGTPSTLRKNINSDREYSSTAVNSLVRRMVCDKVSDSLLTPIREKKSKKIVDYDESTSLIETQRGVKDLQIIIAYELARITTTGYSSLNKNIVLSKKPNNKMTPFAILFFGEFYAHQIAWENSLEDLLLRISTLLDDMLCSASITNNMAGLSKSVQNLRGVEKNRNYEGVGGGSRRSLSREGDSFVDINRGMVTPRGLIPREMTPKKTQSTPLSIDTSSENGDVMRSSVDVDLKSLGRSQASVPQSPCRTSRKNPSNMNNRPPQSAFFPEIDEEINRNSLRSPLETQEILLFYTISLIQTMALDSAKIRAVLASDLKSYWMPIMHVFNTICPRPPLLKSKQTHNSGLSDFMGTINDPPNNEMKKKPFFSKLFKSKTVIEKKIIENEKVEEFDWTSKLATEVTEDLEHLSISDYGPAHYEMSDSSWRLLVMARRATEEIIIMLGLHGGVEEGGPVDVSASIPFRLMEPTPLQVKRNDEQERKSRINRAFEDEDEDNPRSLERPRNNRKNIDIDIDTDKHVENNVDKNVQHINKSIDEIPLPRGRKVFRRRNVENSSHDEEANVGNNVDINNENDNDYNKSRNIHDTKKESDNTIENDNNSKSDKDVEKGTSSSSYVSRRTLKVLGEPKRASSPIAGRKR